MSQRGKRVSHANYAADVDLVRNERICGAAVVFRARRGREGDLPQSLNA